MTFFSHRPQIMLFCYLYTLHCLRNWPFLAVHHCRNSLLSLDIFVHHCTLKQALVVGLYIPYERISTKVAADKEDILTEIILHILAGLSEERTRLSEKTTAAVYIYVAHLKHRKAFKLQCKPSSAYAWSTSAYANKLVPCAWPSSEALEAWSLQLLDGILWQGSPSPLKSMIHIIISPYFHKIHKFTPLLYLNF